MDHVQLIQLKGNKNKISYSNMLLKDFKRNKYIYFMALPIIAFYVLFHYKPMYGAIIAFKDFNPARGIVGSPWVGFKHFNDLFGSPYFGRILKNTLLLSIQQLVYGFPAPIMLALLINEVRNSTFKKAVQTVTYLPHFISLVVVCGMIRSFTGSDGVINDIISYLGGERSSLLLRPELFRPIYIISGIWQEVGWGSIIYLSALMAVDVEQYEAATIDGAGKWRQLWSITIPGIMPTIIIMLILRLGGMLNIGFEKIILLYNPNIYETADVISSFVYRKGILEFSWSFGSAVGLFNSIINFILLICANAISRRLNGTSLW